MDDGRHTLYVHSYEVYEDITNNLRGFPNAQLCGTVRHNSTCTFTSTITCTCAHVRSASSFSSVAVSMFFTACNGGSVIKRSVSHLWYFQPHSLQPQQMGIHERATAEVNTVVAEVIGDGHNT